MILRQHPLKKCANRSEQHHHTMQLLVLSATLQHNSRPECSQRPLFSQHNSVHKHLSGLVSVTARLFLIVHPHLGHCQPDIKRFVRIKVTHGYSRSRDTVMSSALASTPFVVGAGLQPRKTAFYCVGCSRTEVQPSCKVQGSASAASSCALATPVDKN